MFNEKDEEAVLRKFVSHIQELKPHVIVTYNGDKFDWPYVETRCKKYTYLNLYSHLGIRSTAQPAATGECLCGFIIFAFVCCELQVYLIKCCSVSSSSIYQHIGFILFWQSFVTIMSLLIFLSVNKDGTPVAAALFSDNEYTGRCMIHLDAFCWVQRDSYLPQGNQVRFEFYS